jgi:predicted kinase
MVIVITGPIASGKSTVARELARELERTQVRVAVIDLDLLYDRLTTDGPKSDDATWALARNAAATLAKTFLEEGVAVVVAEGSFNTPGDRAAFDQHLDTSVGPRYVTLRVSFEEALRRAQSDATRGVSRDPTFLGPYFAAVGQALATVPVTDIVIDTERMPATSVAVAIASLVRPGPRTETPPTAGRKVGQQCKGKASR